MPIVVKKNIKDKYVLNKNLVYHALIKVMCLWITSSAVFSIESKAGICAIKKLSEKLDISFHFLTKILLQLTAVNLLESHKGPKRGVRLSKPGDDISLLNIVVAIDGDGLLKECVIGLPGCGKEKPCPLHRMWASTRDEIQDMLAANSLKEMAEKGKDGNLRITANGNLKWT